MDLTTAHPGPPLARTQPNRNLIEPRGRDLLPEAVRKTLDNLVALVPGPQRGTARGLAKEIQEAFRTQKQGNQPTESLERLTIANLQRAVTEAVRAAVGPSPAAVQGRTWATIAAQPSQPAKAIPQRISRKTLIRGADLPADLAKRTPAEIIQAINQASTRKGAIAARKLPSNDVVVTFNDPTTKEWHTRNNQWIQQAFGEQAKEAYRTFAVLVKGLQKKDLQGRTEESFGAELGLQTIDKVKFRLPINQGFTRATVLITLGSQEEAKKACDQGVVWNAQILDCEPYWATLEPKQCFKCWKWGHTQRYCRKEALCGRCGIKTHGEGGKAGEALCPTQGGQIPCKCPGCGGRHPAWAKECPEKVKAKKEAREAYQYRPKTFEPRPTTEATARPTTTVRPAFTFEKALL